MSGEHNKELQVALRFLELNGWRVARVSTSGYRIMRCGCGQHQGTLHKTPSNPNHFRQRAKAMVALCSKQVP
jgi:hypothetical protein